MHCGFHTWAFGFGAVGLPLCWLGISSDRPFSAPECVLGSPVVLPYTRLDHEARQALGLACVVVGHAIARWGLAAFSGANAYMAQTGQLADRLRFTAAKAEGVELNAAVGEGVPDVEQVLCAWVSSRVSGKPLVASSMTSLANRTTSWGRT